MVRYILPFITVLLAFIFCISVILFAFFPFNQNMKFNGTVPININSIDTNLFDYNMNEYMTYTGSYFGDTWTTNVQVYSKFNLNSNTNKIYIGLCTGFVYNQSSNFIHFLSNGFHSGAYLVYDITEFVYEHNIGMEDIDNIDDMNITVTSTLMNYSTNLNNDNLAFGYVLPVYSSVLPSSSQVNFSVFNFVNENGYFPNLARISSFPLVSQTVLDARIIEEGVQGADKIQADFSISYSTPEGGWGDMYVDVGFDSYVGNVFTVITFEINHLTDFFDMFGVDEIDTLTELLDVIKAVFEFPINLLRYAYQIVIAFTYNIVLI